jgi:hypothetical protein
MMTGVGGPLGPRSSAITIECGWAWTTVVGLLISPDSMTVRSAKWFDREWVSGVPLGLGKPVIPTPNGGKTP